MKYYKDMHFMQKLFHKFSRPRVFISPRYFNIRYESGDSDVRILTITVLRIALQFQAWFCKPAGAYFKWELVPKRRMKYAILSPADQTIVYSASDYLFEHTTDHAKAKLWDSKQEAEGLCFMHNFNIEDKDFFTIEEVKDEQEFRSRPDTW